MIAPNAKHSRERSNRESDRVIYKLHKDGVLKKDGDIAQVEAKKFLKGKGVQLRNPNLVSPSDFASIGIKMPKIDRRKKIILRYTGEKQV